MLLVQLAKPAMNRPRSITFGLNAYGGWTRVPSDMASPGRRQDPAGGLQHQIAFCRVEESTTGRIHIEQNQSAASGVLL